MSFLLLSLVCVSAAPAGGALSLPVKEYVLENGLKLLVLPRRQVPQVACQVTYRVGSAYERPGKTGLSHFLEHMMFKGTERIGVVDPEKDKLLMKRLDETVKLIKELRLELSPERLELCRRYAEKPSGEPPAEWEKFKRLEALRKRLASLREEQERNLVSEELWKIYRRAGGTGMNAETGYDSTRYFVKLPSGMEELFFWLEADRMENAVFRQFYPEKEVILEERNQRVEGSPTGRFRERLSSVFFEAHPYRQPVIGYEKDIRALSRDDLYAHYRRYYRPNNAIVTLVGDVEPEKCLELARRYFGKLKAGPPVKEPETYNIPDLGVKRLEVELEAPEQVWILYHTPRDGHPDSYALDLASEVLNGTSGRLYRRLVLKEGLAVRVAAWNWTRKFAGQFAVLAYAAPGADLAQVERVLLEEVEGLATRPPSEEELTRARRRMESYFVRSLESLLETAGLVGSAEVVESWRDLEKYLPRLYKVTAEDVASKVKRYLGPVRTVAVVRRAK